MSLPARRPIVIDMAAPPVAPPRASHPTPAPVGQGRRRIDRPIVVNPAAATLPRKDRERIKVAVRLLERIRARAVRKPTNVTIAEYAAIHWALEQAGVLATDGGAS